MFALYFATLVSTTPSVAILPVVNRTPEVNEGFRKEMVDSVSGYLPKGFAANGFHVLDTESIVAAVKQAEVDLEDEEEYRRETFLRIGEAAGADFVYFATVETTGFFSANTGITTLRVWFLGVPDRTRILSSRAVEGESKQRIGSGARSTEIVAGARAAEQSLKLILKSFNREYKTP